MSDLIDKRGGAYDPVTPFGNPQPPQVKDKETPHQIAQWGADVRPECCQDRVKDTRSGRDRGSRAWARSIKTQVADRRRLRTRKPQVRGEQSPLRSLSVCEMPS
jgi:hypothetical protein